MKSIETGEWYPAVAYRPIDGNQVYVRGFDDFSEKFKIDLEESDFKIMEDEIDERNQRINRME